MTEIFVHTVHKVKVKERRQARARRRTSAVQFRMTVSGCSPANAA